MALDVVVAVDARDDLSNMCSTMLVKVTVVATEVSIVDEHPVYRVRMRRRMSCPATLRLHGRLCMLRLAWPAELAVILGGRTDRRRMSLQSPVSHARLSATRPRRWEATMLRNRVTELHFITHVANLGSIVAYGILSHNLVARRFPAHKSVASEQIQDRRVGKRVPQGRLLHDYANLYFDARNAMMYTLLKNSAGPLAVVRVNPAVLDLPDSVVTDGNAASDDTAFFPSPRGLAWLDEDKVYADSWDHPDYWTKVELKRLRCAEVLVPNQVESQFIIGCYVDHRNRRRECSSQSPRLPVEVNAHVFFR